MIYPHNDWYIKRGQLLGINRKLKDVDGYRAVLLWYDYVNNNNKQALRMLLEYNQEDVVNLRVLR